MATRKIKSKKKEEQARFDALIEKVALGVLEQGKQEIHKAQDELAKKTPGMLRSTYARDYRTYSKEQVVGMLNRAVLAGVAMEMDRWMETLKITQSQEEAREQWASYLLIALGAEQE